MRAINPDFPRWSNFVKTEPLRHVTDVLLISELCVPKIIIKTLAAASIRLEQTAEHPQKVVLPLPFGPRTHKSRHAEPASRCH